MENKLYLNQPHLISSKLVKCQLVNKMESNCSKSEP